MLATEIRSITPMESYALQRLLFRRGLVGMLLLAVHGLVPHSSLSHGDARGKLTFALCLGILRSDTILGLAHAAAVVVPSSGASVFTLDGPFL
jgi:hypothetical protein